jgi:hypothetical protein
MKPLLTTSRKTQCLASLFALLATSLTLGGSLLLAGHYAQTGASLDASDYYAAGHLRRLDCADNGNPRVVVATARHAA